MSDHDLNRVDAPTRREYLTSGTALVGAGLLAGCTGGNGGESGEETATNDASGGERGTDTAQTESTEADAGYTASIIPAGEVHFDAVPETWAVYNGGWADMAFALGQREGFLTAGNMIPPFLFEPFDIDVPPQDTLPSMWSKGSWDKESFYELDPDVFLIDPNYLHGTGWDDSWDREDTQEIIKNVAPFFGNNCRRRREFHDYRLYSLYGAFERLSHAFQEQERYEAFATLHGEVQSEIADRAPDEPQTIGLINGGSDPSTGKFYPLNTLDEGYEMKPYRDLNVASAFPQEMENGGQIDYETLLEIDPEIIVVHWGIGTTGDTDSFSADAFREQYVVPMEDDSVAQQLSAVQAGRVYPGQCGEQGPIVNLLQTEIVAQQLYPDEFGAFGPESFPQVPEERQLFDRDRVSDIIAGDT